ncbi:MAG: TRAP transporter substrate-binding protein [Rubrivivax sp.]
MKKRLLLQTALAGAALLLTTAGSQAQSQVRELRMGSPFPSSSHMYTGMQKFAEEVGKETQGRFKVNVYADSQIGGIPQLLTGMQLGTVDMALIGIGVATSLKGGDPLSVAYVPYIFKSKQAATDVLNGPLFTDIFEGIANQSGVRLFVLDGARSPRAFQSTRGPIRKPEDIRGMRVRVPQVEMFRAMFEKLGVKAVQTGMSDIYTALSKGQVEAQDNGFDVSLNFKWHEVAKYWAATDHNFEPVGFYISDKLWKTLAPADQAAFKKAGHAAGALITKLGNEVDRKGVEELKSLGVTYTQPDLGPWRDALKDVHLPYEGKLWPAGMVERIRALPENR